MTKKTEEEKVHVGFLLLLTPFAFIGFVTSINVTINFIETVHETKVEVKDLEQRVDHLQSYNNGMTVYWGSPIRNDQTRQYLKS